jgi:predicted nucleic acid-binding protein
VLTELWVVATRPTEVNGLGWSAARTTEEISRLMDEFPLLEESQQVFSVWLNLVTTLSVLGKQAHDARIAATMLVYGVTHLLTFNTKDFIQVPGINEVDPQAVVSVS